MQSLTQQIAQNKKTEKEHKAAEKPKPIKQTLTAVNTQEKNNLNVIVIANSIQKKSLLNNHLAWHKNTLKEFTYQKAT